MAEISIAELDPERTVVVATGNAHKVVEIETILAPVMPGVRFVALGELGDFPDPVEDGDTFFDNALIKARAAQKETGLPMAVADDSGLCVDALDGAPGIFSARWAGEHGNDAANNEKLMAQMAGVPDSEAHRALPLQRCRWCAAMRSCAGMATARASLATSRAESTASATIRSSCLTETPGRTMAELTLDEKNLISHRFHALEDLADKL